jgi:hypothetical protein
MQFLGTGPGVLLSVAVGVLLILWALLTQSPETDSASMAAPQIAESQGRDRTALRTAEEWYEQPKITVTDANFVGQPVTLDGYHYDRCTFRDCTFVYRGEKPFAITNFKIEGDNNIEAASGGSLHLRAGRSTAEHATRLLLP